MNSELLTTISQKLQQATNYSVLEKKREKMEAEQHMAAIEESLIQRRTREQAQIEQNRRKVDQLGQLLQETLRGMAIESAREGEKVNALRQELQIHVENAQKGHQDKLEDVKAASEEKIMAVNEELQKKSKMQKEKVQNHLNSLGKRLAAVQKEFREQAESRTQGQERMRTHFYDELEQFKEVIQRERERRVSSERKMEAMMEQIQEKLSQEIEALASRRKRNNESILKLIELACQKIEEKYQE